MSLLCDYFMAPSPEAAASVLDWTGGPEHPPAGKRSLLRRSQPTESAYEVVSLPGVEPTVTLGQLDALLTGRSIREVIHDSDRDPIASADGGERLVVPLGPRFEEAIAAMSEDQVPGLAEQWSQAEEFWGQGDRKSSRMECGSWLPWCAEGGNARSTCTAGSASSPGTLSEGSRRKATVPRSK